jgi:hypothetical protein
MTFDKLPLLQFSRDFWMADDEKVVTYCQNTNSGEDDRNNWNKRLAELSEAYSN